MNSFDQRIDSLMPTSVVKLWDCNASSRVVKTGSLQSRTVEPLEYSVSCGCDCYIVPPHLQKKIEDFRLQDEDADVRASAHSHIERDEAFRFHRFSVVTGLFSELQIPHPFDEEESVVKILDPKTLTQKLVRVVYDDSHTEKLPGKQIVSTQGSPADPKTYKQKGSVKDPTVNKALDNALSVFLFYLNNYKYNSIDGKGMNILSTVHYGQNYENAFWNGHEMVYGDGSDLFKPFVYFLDVVGHELTHGVTGNRLNYEGESGALNEHFSDVMGYLVYMYKNGLDTASAKWVLADGILQYDGKSYPLRSFKAPGTAYDIPDLGKDPQPAKYGDLYTGEDDDGGVHINSGIPNHAFYLFAQALGGKPWDKAGLIWFTTMMTKGAFSPEASMADFANATVKTAQTLFKSEPKVAEALLTAWRQVEVLK